MNIDPKTSVKDSVNLTKKESKLNGNNDTNTNSGLKQLSNENSSLKSKIQLLEVKLKELENYQNSLKLSNHKKDVVIKTTKSTVEKLQKKLDQKLKKVSNLEKIINSFEKRKVESEKKISQLAMKQEVENEELNKIITSKSEALDNFQTNEDILRKEKESLRIQLTNGTQRYKKLELKFLDIKEENAKLKEKTLESSLLKVYEVNQLKHKFDQEKEKLVNLPPNLSLLKGTEKEKSVVENLELRQKRNEKQLFRLRMVVDRLKVKNIELIKEVENTREKFTKKAKKVDLKRVANLRNLKEEITYLQLQLDEKEESSKNQIHKLISLDKIIFDNQNEIKGLKEQIKEILKENKIQKSQLAEKNSTIELLLLENSQNPKINIEDLNKLIEEVKKENVKLNVIVEERGKVLKEYEKGSKKNL